MINSFTGKYRFLSNFYPAILTYEGLAYPSSEHAYQAAKSESETVRKIFGNSTMSAGQAKRLGATIEKRKDWHDVSLGIMEDIVRIKFQTHPKLAKKLRETGDHILVEGNNWGDIFWGMVNNEGENHLGKILMKIREELRTDSA